MEMLFGYNSKKSSEKRKAMQAYSEMRIPYWFAFLFEPKSNGAASTQLWHQFLVRCSSKIRSLWFHGKEDRPLYPEDVSAGKMYRHRMAELREHVPTTQLAHISRYDSGFEGTGPTPVAIPHPKYEWDYDQFPFFRERLRVLREQYVKLLSCRFLVYEEG